MKVGRGGLLGRRFGGERCSGFTNEPPNCRNKGRADVGCPSIAVRLLPERLHVSRDAPKPGDMHLGLETQGPSSQLNDSGVAELCVSRHGPRPFVEATFELVQQANFV